MVSFAEHQFKLIKPQKDGTLKEHLEQVERQTGKRPKELDGPEFPSLMSHIWTAFLDLNNARGMGAHTANPLSYSEIASYVSLMATPLTPRDIEAIKALDSKYLEVMNKDG